MLKIPAPRHRAWGAFAAVSLLVTVSAVYGVAWWRLLAVSVDQPGPAASLISIPKPVWRLADPARGELVALRDDQFERGTVIGLPGDRLSLQPVVPAESGTLTVESGNRSQTFDLYDSQGLVELPGAVPSGDLLVYGEYFGGPGVGGPHSVARLVGAGQVEGVVLDDWRAVAVYALGCVLVLAWPAAAAFLLAHRRNRGFYCRACGHTSGILVPEGRQGFVFCPSCRSAGMALYNRLPRLVRCPVEGCLMRVWDDGVADSMKRQHEGHASSRIRGH